MSAPDLRELVTKHGGEYFGTYALIPGPGHSRRDRSLCITVGREGRVIYKSFSSDTPDHVSVLQYLGIDVEKGPARLAPGLRAKIERGRLAEEQAERAKKLDWCSALWGETVPTTGTIVETYLAGRNLPGRVPGHLRFHAAAPLDYERRTTAPALVGIVLDHRSQAIGLHLTALQPDGSGKAGANPRRMFGPVKGGAVQLAPIDRGLIAVAEGIETALSFAALTGSPTWAALSTAGLEGFEPPADVTRLTIAADGDAAGMKAAEALARRLERRCAVTISPAPDGQDWNGVINERGAP
jgi:phage/plasmid primase-like uncharacterized protein